MTISLPVITPEDKPQDVSARALDLARRIDRLTPGVYELTIEKPEVRAMDWHVEITRMEKIVSIRLPKYVPE